ncbi:hypothetical protein Trydic_g1971 [Trypoxylus dichotomus]
MKISKKIRDYGYSVTPDMYDKKFRNLKVTYKMKDNIKETDRGRQHWEYFSIMEDIFKEDATVNPPLLICSLKPSAGRGTLQHKVTVFPRPVAKNLPFTSGVRTAKGKR